MKKNKILIAMLIILLLILTVSMVSAAQIKNFKLTWAGEQIEYLSPDTRLPVNIEFDYELEQNDSEINQIIVDASDLTTDIRIKNNYDNISITTCKKINETQQNSDMHCEILNKVLQTKDTEIKTGIFIEYADGKTETSEQTIALKLDNTKPEVTYFGPTTCDTQGTCYVIPKQSNKINIQMQDTTASFNRKRISYKLGQNTGLVYDCDGLNCYGFASPICSDGQILQLIITTYNGQPSQDDAGNSLTGKTNTQVKCDGTIPEIKSTTISSSSGLDAITINDNVILTLNVTELISPQLNITINASSINAGEIKGTCTLQNKQFVCTASITPQTDQPGTYPLQIKVKDVAGNEKEITKTFKLLGINEQQKIDLWKVSKVELSNNKISIQNLDYPRTVYAFVKLNNKQKATEIVTLKEGSSSCIPEKINSTGNIGDIRDFKIVQYDAKNKNLIASFNLREKGSIEKNRYNKFNKIKYTCNISINSKQGETFFSSPEKETFEIEMQITNMDSLDRFVLKDIDKTQNEIESLQSEIKDWNTFYLTSQALCLGKATLGTSLSYLGATEQGASTTPFTKGVAVGSGVSGDLIKTPLALDPTSKYVKFFCDAASCNASYMNSLKDSISGSVPGNVMSTADTISGIGSGQDFLDNWLDPYKNEMLAYASFCPDAITQHLSRKLEIQCSYLGCLETDVKQSGAPPGVCQRTKQFSECVYSNQQMFSLIPFANVIKDATKLASNIISDPIQMGLTAGALACTEGVGGAIFGIEPGSWFHGACNTYAGVTTAFNYYNSAMNMVGKFKNVLGSETNSCPASQKLNVRRSQKEIGTYPEPLTPDKDYLERTGLSCYSSHCTKMEGNKELIYTFSKNDNGESVINIYSRQKDQESMKYLGSTEDIQIPKYTKNNIDAKGNINDKEIVTVADLKAQGLDESINNADIEGKKTNNKAETTVDESYWVAADNQDVEDILNSARFSDSNNDPNNPISQEIQTKSNAVFESYNNYKKQINNYDTELDKLNLDETIIKTGAFKSYNEQLITDLELPAIGDLTKSEIIEQLNLEEGKFISGTELKVRLKAIQAKNSKGDLNSKIKDLDDVYKKEITEYTYQQYFGSLENAMRTIHGISNGASVMTNLIFRNKDIAFGKDTILGSFSQTLNKASNFEEILCEEKLQTDVSLAGQAVIDRTENGNFRNGAFISGRRTGLIETENTTYYDYYFQAKIQTKKPTKVQIILKGSSQLDITKEISNTNQILVQPEIPITLSNGKYHIYTSKEKYDSVCLKFNTKIKNIYDQTSIDGDEICSTIIKEEK